VSIVGEPGVGKSHLAKWCAELCAARGMQIVYVQFGGVTVDVLGALRWIRDGQRPPPPRTQILPNPNAPLPPAAFRRFTQKLNGRMRGVISAEGLPEPTADVADENIPDAAGTSSDLAFIEDTFHDFRLALEAAAKVRPLLLVLDQLEALESVAREQLIRGISSHCSRQARQGSRSSKRGTEQGCAGDAHRQRVQTTPVDVSYFKRASTIGSCGIPPV
jgi:hypothetical protein